MKGDAKMKLKELRKKLQISGRVVIRWIDDDPEELVDDEWFFDFTQTPKEYGLCEIIRLYAIHPIDSDMAVCIELRKDW